MKILIQYINSFVGTMQTYNLKLFSDILSAGKHTFCNLDASLVSLLETDFQKI